MILLISQKYAEHSTDWVIDWLIYKKAIFFRMNGESLYENLDFSFQIDENTLTFNHEKINFSNVKIVWFRRWSNPFLFDEINKSDLNNDDFFIEDFNNIRKIERFGIRNIFFNSLKNKKWLDLPPFLGIDYPSKIEQLLVAKKVGLRVPETIITDSKKRLIEFLKTHNQLITKSSNDIRILHYKEKYFAAYTALIDESKLSKIPDFFYPSLFQEKIEKEVELRVFYFFEEIYAMAIFSTLDTQTEIDFRRYNYDRPNRTIPFKIPHEVSIKLIKFMKSLNLNHGSLDLILTPLNEFILLEVNPVGQFGMVSDPCNYFLEKKIADYLIKNDI